MDYQRGAWYRPACPCKGAPVRSGEPACIETDRNSAVGLKEIKPTSLAIAWSPYQQWRMLYEPCKALSRGTLFAELDKPFSGKC